MARGPPLLDEFSKQAFDNRKPIAPRPFMAQLPTKMLGHAKGGALAVIGHVERAWGYSFMTSGSGGGPQITLFEETFNKLLDGYPVGSAIEATNERYSELATELTTAVEEREFDPSYISDRDLAAMWTRHNDARGYIIVGDPAVRMPTVAEKDAPPPERPDIILPASVQAAIAASDAPDKAAEDDPSPEPPASDKDGPPPDYDPAQDFSIQVGDLQSSLREFIRKVAEAVQKATDEITTLEVETYATGDLEATRDGQGTAQLRAYTRIRFDGDMENYVPRSGGQIDHDLWHVHLDMVREAQANRAQLIGALAEMAAKLMDNLK